MGNARHYDWGSPAAKQAEPDTVFGETVYCAGVSLDLSSPGLLENLTGHIDLRELTECYRAELAGGPIDPSRHIPTVEPEPPKSRAGYVTAAAAVGAFVLMAVAVVLLLVRGSGSDGADRSASSDGELKTLAAGLVVSDVDEPEISFDHDPVEVTPTSRAVLPTTKAAAKRRVAKTRRAKAKVRRARPAVASAKAKVARKSVKATAHTASAAKAPVAAAVTTAQPATAETEPAEPAAAKCTAVECLLDATLPCCPKKAPVKKVVSVPDRPSAAVVRKRLASLNGKFSVCGDKHAQVRSVVLRFTIAADGRIQRAVIPGASDALAGCLQRVLARARFGASRNGLSTSYPLSFRRF